MAPAPYLDDFARHNSRTDPHGDEARDGIGSVRAARAGDYWRVIGFRGGDDLSRSGSLFDRAPQGSTGSKGGASVMRYFLALVLSCGLTCSPARAQRQGSSGSVPAQTEAGTPLTLRQAEGIALKNNPQITVGKLRALEAQQYIRETRSALLPT